MATWEENLAIYDNIVSKCKGFERLGKTMPYTSANGYMFSMLNKDGELGIRLPKESAKKFMEKHNTGIYKSYGSVVKDYVLIPEELLSNTRLLAKTLQESFEYVMSLPSKRGKK